MVQIRRDGELVAEHMVALPAGPLAGDPVVGGTPNSPMLGQNVTWEPMTTVRSSGSRKYVTGLAALRATAMNSLLRQRRMVGASVGTMVIRERK